jgi:hypothetical protein
MMPFVRRILAEVLDGYEELELTPRARHIARTLRRHLPEEYERAIEILVSSLGPKLETAELKGMDVFSTCHMRSSSRSSAPSTSRRRCAPSTS